MKKYAFNTRVKHYELQHKMKPDKETSNLDLTSCLRVRLRLSMVMENIKLTRVTLKHELGVYERLKMTNPK